MQSFPSTPSPFLLFLISQESRGAAAGRSNGGGDPPTSISPGVPRRRRHHTTNDPPSLHVCVPCKRVCVCVDGGGGRKEKSLYHIYGLPSFLLLGCPSREGKNVSVQQPSSLVEIPSHGAKSNRPCFPSSSSSIHGMSDNRERPCPHIPHVVEKKGKRSAYVINRKDRRSKEEAGGSLCKHEAPPFGLVFGSGRMVVHRRRRLPILLLCQCNPPSSSTSSSPLSHLQKTARKKFPRGERERGGKGEKTAVGKEKEQIPPSSPDGLRG